jgi:hypothetical protein
MAGIRDLAPVVLIFGVAGLILVFVTLIVSQVGAQIATMESGTTLALCNTVACNSSKSLQTAMGNFANWFTLLILVVVAAIVIGLLVGSFSGGAMTK